MARAAHRTVLLGAVRVCDQIRLNEVVVPDRHSLCFLIAGFAVFELVVSPILAAAVVFSWFGSLLPLAWAWMRSICCGQRSVWKRWSPAG